MKLSEDYFRRRRKSFRRRIVATSGVIIVVVVALLTFIFWVKATVVEVIPETASMTAQRTLNGWGWVQQDKVYLLAHKARLEISATGFITETILLEHDTLERHITVELKEAPALIKASATPADPKIQWQIDAKYAGSGANLQATVEPGTHTLEVSHPYYQSQKTSIDLARGTEKTLEFILEPIQGRIKLSSEPEGMPVLLNDESIGLTPVSLVRQGGLYRLQIETSDFQTINDTVEITYQQPIVNRNYKLVYKKALLSFKLTPPGGQLLVDGKMITTNNIPIEIDTMRELIINYAKAGYFPQTIKRTLKPNQKDHISISLKAEFGEIVINATPQANLELDGEAIGQTPQTLRLSAIPHTIHLSKPGYRTVQKVIRPSSRRTIQINEALMTEQQARLAESPTTFKNSIGIELVLFKPNKTANYELGAHRSEKGQRANEILRTVRLDKAFYVSRTEISAKHYHAFNSRIPISNLAVNNVSWNDAAFFCNWLSEQEKLPLFYITDNNIITGYDPDSAGYRLPSEAEWEWLARYANRSTSVQFIWGEQTIIPKNIGNLADESAKNNVAVYIPNYNDGYSMLAPIGSFKRDSAGLYDLAGNIAEWVHDVYIVENTASIQRNPLGVSNNTGRSGHVVKGSSWRSGTLLELRSVYRRRAIGKADDIGFRIARYIY